MKEAIEHISGKPCASTREEIVANLWDIWVESGLIKWHEVLRKRNVTQNESTVTARIVQYVFGTNNGIKMVASVEQEAAHLVKTTNLSPERALLKAWSKARVNFCKRQVEGGLTALDLALSLIPATSTVQEQLLIRRATRADKQICRNLFCWFPLHSGRRFFEHANRLSTERIS